MNKHAPTSELTRRKVERKAAMIEDPILRWQDHIERRPGIMLGKPVIKGTRITVQHILERLGWGWPIEDLLQSHPRLKPEHIQASIAYAADAMSTDELIMSAGRRP